MHSMDCHMLDSEPEGNKYESNPKEDFNNLEISA